MKCYVSLLCVLSLLFAFSHAAPAPSAAGSQGSSADTTEILSRISDKFTQNIQLLRRLCPPLFQVIDTVVQNVTSQLFSIVGRVVLRSGLGGGLGGGGDSMVSVVLPTFPPDDEDEDESTQVSEVSSATTTQIVTLDDSYVRIINNMMATSTPSTSSSSSSQIPLELPLSVNEIRVDPAEQTLYTSRDPSVIDPIFIRGKLGEQKEDDVEATTVDIKNLQEDKNKTKTLEEIREESIAAIFKGIAELQGDQNEIDATTPKEERLNIKVVQDGEIVNTISLMSPSSDTRAKREAETSENDQEPAASGGNGPEPAEDLADVADEGDRDKRYSPFGGDAGHGGGSGNFLFDIIRQTADRAARAAGTIYRMVAGTENLGIGLSASTTSTGIVDASSQLIAGSGATEESDEKEHGGVGAGGVAEIDVAKGADGYTEGIPGPITRLFVIANRGLANLVQDLILRLAQTSERIVNFKARLITALI